MASPRKGGNVDRLLDFALDGASSAGAQTIKVVLAEKTIRPCNACMACRKTGNCVIDDDMQEIYKLLYQCDGFVFGSPVYHRNVSCYMKVLFDRIVGVITTYRRGQRFSRLPVSRLGKGKRALVVTSLGASFPVSVSQLRDFRKTVRSFTDYAHMEVINYVVTENTWVKKAEDFTDINQKAYEWGKRLVLDTPALSSRLGFAYKDAKTAALNKILDKIDPPL